MHFLQCRQNDIRRLWIESLQHKYVHRLLEEIDSLRKVPEELNSNVMDEKLLHCTEVLVSSLKLLNDQFGNIDALKELKKELSNFGEKLYSVLLEELFKELYTCKLEPFYEWLGSYKVADSAREESADTLLGRTTETECIFNMNADNSRVIVLSDCLNMLGKIPDAVDVLKVNCQKELLALANRASMFMKDSIESHSELHVLELSNWKQQLVLYDLLNAVLNIFRQVSSNHKMFLNVLQKLSEVEQLTESTYEMADFYSKAQSAIEYFVSFYLESREPTSSFGRSASFLANSRNMNELAELFDSSPQKEIRLPSMFKFKEQNILSISWAKDRDIRRLLKSYSNWKHLLFAENNDVIKAPEDIRRRNKEESDLLIRNLNSEEQASWDIITNFNKLLNIALLEESLDWLLEKFAVLIQFVNDTLSTISSAAECFFTEAEEKVCPEYAVGGLMKLKKEYEDFQDMCLVALHLEVRAHCFRHLLPFSDQTNYLERNYSKEYSIAVKSLSDELLKVDEILLPILDAKKLTYIFEGLGELISSILIHNITNLHKISDAILLQMGRSIFVIQCCLGNITMTRGVFGGETLDRARQYIELFHLSCEEILSRIVEEGPKFQESEYASVLRLLCPPADQSNSNEMLEIYCDKLNRLFEGVGTSI
ncbi:uncharacterized protein LOC129222997 [Uloborus diversus]|uniref:uncharacterized protein LOC129222997 n=1 Tax=Uloborus diversus TaxID=327109 RepID=UPI00240959B9|nr:uncharacterized protein LOC129222997 [Uloborus diversus]